MSHMSSVPLAWRLQKPKYRMVGSACTTCKALYFPPRGFCPACRRKGKLQDHQFKGEGKILTYTVIRTAPEGFEEYAPYAIAIIELEGGVTISGQVVGNIDRVTMGKTVRTTFRKIFEDNSDGLIHYGLKWELAE